MSGGLSGTRKTQGLEKGAGWARKSQSTRSAWKSTDQHAAVPWWGSTRHTGARLGLQAAGAGTLQSVPRSSLTIQPLGMKKIYPTDPPGVISPQHLSNPGYVPTLFIIRSL